MIKGGYYIKARKIQESIIAHAPPHIREIWDWIIKEANHQDKKYGKFTVKRGQLFRTYPEIREGLHWRIGWRKEMYNENHVKKAMKFLRENLMVTTKKEPGGVLITIVNYDVYQNPKSYERTDERTNERTIAEPLRNQPLPDNNKNDNNVKNEKEYKKELLNEISKEKFPELNNDFIEIAQSYQKLFLKNCEDAGVKNSTINKAKGTWIDDVRLMVESDKRTIDEFRVIFKFLKDDDFWKVNILSTSKLRIQFEQLLMKSNYARKKQGSGTTKELLGEMEQHIEGIS